MNRELFEHPIDEGLAIDAPWGNWNVALLVEHLKAISGIRRLRGHRGIVEKRILGNRVSFFADLEDDADEGQVKAAIDTVINSHVAMPQAGGAGLSIEEKQAAWVQIGKQIAARDPVVKFFWQEGPGFYGVDLSQFTQEQLNAGLARAIYCGLRATGEIPPPPNYDPLLEATYTVDANGDLHWTASGPPW